MCEVMGLNIVTITEMKPTMAPTNAIGGKLNTPGCGSATAIQPTAADTISNANNTMLALAVPLTVMTPPWYVLTGPSVNGGAHVSAG